MSTELSGSWLLRLAYASCRERLRAMRRHSKYADSALILHNMYISSQSKVLGIVSIGGFVAVGMMEFSPTALVGGSSHLFNHHLQIIFSARSSDVFPVRALICTASFFSFLQLIERADHRSNKSMPCSRYGFSEQISHERCTSRRSSGSR